MLPVSTRSDLVARRGLGPFVRALLKRGVPSVVVEPPAPGVALAGRPEDLAAIEAPVLAYVGPAVPPEEFPEAHVGLAADRARSAAFEALRGVRPWMTATRCRRLVVPVGAAGFPSEAPVRKALAEGAGDRASRVAAHRAETSAARQAHAETLCRALHALRADFDGARLLLLPDADPLGFLDPEAAGWILEAVRGLQLALDSGAVAAAEWGGGPQLSGWLAGFGSSLGLILLADHDGKGDAARLPGAGRSDFARFREVIGPGLPHVVRGDPRAVFDDVLASSEEARRRLGPIGDPSEW